MKEETKSISAQYKFWFLVGGAAFTCFYAYKLTFYLIPKENQNIAYLILGVLLGACIKDAYSYLFGSTESSKAKDDTIAASQKNMTTALNSMPPEKPTDK